MASKTVQPGSQLPEDLVSILDGLGKTETDARQLVESISFRRIRRSKLVKRYVGL